MQKSKSKMIIQDPKFCLPAATRAAQAGILPRPVVSFAVLLGIFTFSIFPYSAFASNVYIDTSHSDFFVGDTILFSVRVDSLNKNINAVEGSVMLDDVTGSVSLIDINTSGSKFSLWPLEPLPSDDNTSISFAGGTPLGLNSKNTIIFNIVLKLQKEGHVTLAPNDFSVYLHDGKGTKDEVHVKNLVIDVLPKKPDAQSVDDWNNITSNDTTPPQPFEIYLGQEGSVFDGKKFLSFSTTDEQSSVAYYEVIEGDLPPVQSSGTYILQEQHTSAKVTIIAYDSAGNARESIYSYIYSPTPYTVSYPRIIIMVIIIILLIFVFVIYKKRRGFPKNTSV